jgi:hypothetical protein
MREKNMLLFDNDGNNVVRIIAYHCYTYIQYWNENPGKGKEGIEKVTAVCSYLSAIQR